MLSGPAFRLSLTFGLFLQSGISQRVELAHCARRAGMELGHKNRDHVFLRIDRESSVEEPSH